MGRRPNPDLVGMTDRQKQAYAQRLYRANHREKNRKYNAEYQRQYTKDPAKVLPRIEREIAHIQSRIDALMDQYNAKLAPYAEKMAVQMAKHAEALAALKEKAMTTPMRYLSVYEQALKHEIIAQNTALQLTNEPDKAAV